MGESVFTTGEIAKLVSVNFRTVIRWIERGELEGYKLPGRGDHRVTRSALLAFIEKHKMPMPEELSIDQHSQRKALIVDDEEAMVNAIARVFRRDGWVVETATDGFQAGALLMEFKPTLMTLDLKMPGMDGFNMLTFTREHLNSERLKILVISAQPQSDLNKALEMGADAVLEKPFENTQLLEHAKCLFTA